MQEYNELRLEKIETEHYKYYKERIRYIIQKLYFENVVEEPEYEGYNLNVSLEKETASEIKVYVEYSCSYSSNENSEYLKFPREWMFLKQEDLYNKIAGVQTDKYLQSIKIKKIAEDNKKHREIEELEKKLNLLKGGVK